MYMEERVKKYPAEMNFFFEVEVRLFNVLCKHANIWCARYCRGGNIGQNLTTVHIKNIYIHLLLELSPELSIPSEGCPQTPQCC